MTGAELDIHPEVAAKSRRELRIPGRDLTADAVRATADERFSEEDYRLMEAGVAPKTKKTLKEAWKRVLNFCADEGFSEAPPWPVERVLKVFHWAWQQDGWRGQPYAPATVEGMLWAITKAHKVARRPEDGLRGYQTPVDTEEVRRAFRGYKKRFRHGKHRSRKASPISPDEQIAMVKALDPRSVIGLQGALALSWLYDGGFRAGELVVPKELAEEMGRSGVRFEHVELATRRDIDWEAVDWRRPWDIELDTEGQNASRADHLIIHVPESKTDQEGDGDEVLLPAHPPEYAFNCPVRLFIAWTKLLMELGHERRGTVLRVIRYGGRGPQDGRPRKGTVTEEPLAYDGLAILFKRWVSNAGLDAGGVTRNFLLHGMRAGSAEAAAEGGADTPELNRHFRWSQFGTTAQRYAARGKKRAQNPARRIWRVA